MTLIENLVKEEKAILLNVNFSSQSLKENLKSSHE